MKSRAATDYEYLVARTGRDSADRMVALGYIEPDDPRGPQDSSFKREAKSSSSQPRLVTKDAIRSRRMNRLPHPLPYQGSKRSLAPQIAPMVPRNVACWYEPFAGSAALTLWAASENVASRYVIADSLGPLAQLWTEIIERPDEVSARYRSVWEAQERSGSDYFNRVRERYNDHLDPVDLMYLVCRCVKNAVRFNAAGKFTQSVDKRRLGMRPEKMQAAVFGASHLLKGKTEVRVGDWLKTTADAKVADFIYMDPPYLGTTVGRDKRYASQLALVSLIGGLESLLARNVRFILSYDGMTGGKTYGDPLPQRLGLEHLHLDAGRSSQATLVGRDDRTIESLYLSPGLASPAPGTPSQTSFSFALAS
ncbi:MAG: DNA adenine methylase [Hyphomonadaceae bacterium]|nr:DNA adenine methylase [Hyphomonadaceae bacterium]